ncbi:50S ribosomal protein L11 [Endogone sp. FLAS-F59071]|nr:50S ribosomal protein L11 [Endogone sp. FLAS-F59071]|eukprot:RUS20127.1 50S ribosomal protein L11 [Endogone sp. FLAS-F59071]
MSKKPAAAGAGAAVSLLKILVPAGKATPSPPVGPALGQRGVKSIDFCKQFNDRTKDILPDTPIPTVISIKPDRTFTFVTKSPPTTYLLKKAAGVEKGASKTGTEVVGKLSLKHVYEIAKIKQQDENLKHLGLKEIAGSIVGVAKSVGIEIVP